VRLGDQRHNLGLIQLVANRDRALGSRRDLSPRSKMPVAKVPGLRIEIVKRSGDMKGFVVLPGAAMVERTFSWFGRNRRLAKDYENLADTLATFVTLAAIQLGIRHLARREVRL
jgi:Transposase DDE domain